MSKYWSTMARRAEPYVPGMQVEKDVIKLNTNENPYGPSPKVIQAMQEEVGKLHLYPSPTADELREVVGGTYNLNADEVFIGNGSDEVLAFSYMAFFEPGKTIRYPAITYSFYPAFAAVFDIPYEEVPMNEDLTLPIEAYFNSEGGVIFPNPNAPTSLYLELEHIEAVLQQNEDQVVIIDEAYTDFAKESAASLIRKYDNLLVIQTTSKSRSLAGLRVGLALGNPNLIEALNRMKDSFNSYTLDRLALVGAQAAFEDKAYFKETTNKIISTRERFTKELEELGFSVLPSSTNFVFATHKDHNAKVLYEELEKANILTRYFDQDPIQAYIRISIGTDEQMDLLLSKLKELMDK